MPNLSAVLKPEIDRLSRREYQEIEKTCVTYKQIRSLRTKLDLFQDSFTKLLGFSIQNIKVAADDTTESSFGSGMSKQAQKRLEEIESK